MSTFRVCLAGIENSHAEEIIRYLNVDQPEGVPVRVVALVAGTPERTRQLAELGSIDTIVVSPMQVWDRIDALIITSRDGALHKDLAVPFLEGGKPVWVDKPLAASVADAEAIIAAAKRSGTVMTSYSAVRWVADTQEIEDALATVGELQTVTLTGPADPHSEHSGIFFYGIHIADVAQRLVPGRPSDIEVQQTRNAVIASYRVGDVRVTLEFVRPDGDGHVPFRATAVGRCGIVSRDIRLGADYVHPGADVFARMLATGTPPLTDDALVAPIILLEHVSHAIQDR